LTAALALTATVSGRAEVVSTLVEYKQADTVLEGLSVYDDAVIGKRPGVLIAHQWTGLGEHEKKRAEMLAGLGYNVFALDIYGRGIRPQTPQAAATEAAKYENDRALLRARVGAGLEVLTNHELTDPRRIAGIGYGLGGMAVLELARSGTCISGVVSFYGRLSSPAPPVAKNIRANVLVLCGIDDPYVPASEVATFKAEMVQAGVVWQVISYGGAVHRFSDRNAGSDGSTGSAYNERADRRSWEAMKQFLTQVFTNGFESAVGRP